MRVRFLAAAAALALSPTLLAGGAHAATPGPHVLTVGTWHGAKGMFGSIQAAVDAASPGDWILIAPGDYKERGDYQPGHQATGTAGAGVWIDKPDLHLRGLDRNGVVVDGTKPGAPACSNAASDQDLGPDNLGRNGIEVWRASGVTIDNLTACNFLEVGDATGNEIWWNGGYDTGQVFMHSYRGTYLSATSTYYKDATGPQASYGVFVSAASGPGLIQHAYASNMNDSGFYIGACPDCNAVLDRAHAENNVLGYSGTNSGGHLVISNGEWDDNGTGINTDSESNDDLPAPQDGACPAGQTGPTGTGSCWVVTGNYIHDNNNRNVPGNGLGLVGAGVVVAGGKNDTITNNRIERNGAWGVALTPQFQGVQTENGVLQTQDCTDAGGTWDNWFIDLLNNGKACFFDDSGSTVTGNRFAGNGTFGNVTNADLADLSDFRLFGIPAPKTPNCWTGNTDPAGITSSPNGLQVSSCAAAPLGANPLQWLIRQVLCDFDQLQPTDIVCGGATYPRQTTVTMKPLPKQATMPNPFAGVPASSPWKA